MVKDPVTLVSNANAVNLNNLDARYTKPADVTAAIAAQLPTFKSSRKTIPATILMTGGGVQAVSASTSIYDTGSLQTGATGNQLFVIPSGQAGYYRFDVKIACNMATGSGAAAFFTMVNGTSKYTLAIMIPSTGGDNTYSTSDVLQLAAGDAIGMSYYANTGNMNLKGTDAFTSFTLTKLS